MLKYRQLKRTVKLLRAKVIKLQELQTKFSLTQDEEYELRATREKLNKAVSDLVKYENILDSLDD